MPLYYKLMNNILVGKEGDSASATEMKRIMTEDLKSRYSDHEEILTMISGLDPRFKSLPFLTEEQRSTVFLRLISKAADMRSPTTSVKQEPGVASTSTQAATVSSMPALPLLGDMLVPTEPDPHISHSQSASQRTTVTTEGEASEQSGS